MVPKASPQLIPEKEHSHIEPEEVKFEPEYSTLSWKSSTWFKFDVEFNRSVCFLIYYDFLSL